MADSTATLEKPITTPQPPQIPTAPTPAPEPQTPPLAETTNSTELSVQKVRDLIFESWKQAHLEAEQIANNPNTSGGRERAQGAVAALSQLANQLGLADRIREYTSKPFLQRPVPKKSP